MSAQSVMTALATILPAGTTIAQTVVEKGINAVSGPYPALIVNCPHTDRARVAVRAKKETHQVHVLYLDRWEDSTRTLEQILTDTRTAITQMVANVDANPTLKIAGVANCIIAGDKMSVSVDGPVRDDALGFPLITAELVIEVEDLWIYQ